MFFKTNIEKWVFLKPRALYHRNAISLSFWSAINITLRSILLCIDKYSWARLFARLIPLCAEWVGCCKNMVQSLRYSARQKIALHSRYATWWQCLCLSDFRFASRSSNLPKFQIYSGFGTQLVIGQIAVAPAKITFFSFFFP